MAAPRPTPTILVIDDSPTICRFVRLVLREAGFAVEVRHDLEDLGSLAPEAPGLVLLDADLGSGVDGAAAVARLRAGTAPAPAPTIVLYSALPDRELASLAELRAADGWIHKSPSGPELLAAIRRFLPAPSGAAP